LLVSPGLTPRLKYTTSAFNVFMKLSALVIVRIATAAHGANAAMAASGFRSSAGAYREPRSEW
jgi:hypothetical protein